MEFRKERKGDKKKRGGGGYEKEDREVKRIRQGKKLPDD